MKIIRNEMNESVFAPSLWSGLPSQWDILIVDDDPDVHVLTEMVLGRVFYLGRPIVCHSAYSGSEGLDFLSRRHMAVALIDVVMEKDTAGLDLVRTIREMSDHDPMRIILRTGQPGAAPESSVIISYDINDYREKTELTAQKLQTVVITALRSYNDLLEIDRNRKGLRRILTATSNLFAGQTIQRFAEICLNQLNHVMNLSEGDSGHKVSAFIAGAGPHSSYVIMAATGKYADYSGLMLDALLLEHAEIRTDIASCLTEKTGLLMVDRLTLYHESPLLTPNLIHIQGIRSISDGDLEMMEVFHSTLSIAFDNMMIRNESEEAQREIIFSLGEVIEGRSRETGAHVKRMTEMCRCLAKRHGLQDEKVEILSLAAPLHDIGKLSIPDAILCKPGKLDKEEFELVKAHTRFGYDILKRSNRIVFRVAAIIALQHHERWDGMGYPNALAGEAIDLFARIVAIADVYDALTSSRVYKKAWTAEAAVSYIRDHSGTQFDPNICDTFLQCCDELQKIQILYTDELPGELIGNHGP